LKVMVDKQFADLPQKFIDEIEFTDTVYKASPTADCPNGTRGRIALLEVMDIDKDIENVILRSPTEEDVKKVARAKGMITMKEDAIIKAMHGIISFEEMNMI